MFKTSTWTLVATALLTCMVAGCDRAIPSPPITPVTVFEGDSTYQELDVPESPWYGTLKEAAEGGYTLGYGDDEQTLYTKDAEARLEPFVNHKVVVTGKLAATDGGALLWPASMKRHDDGLLACSAVERPPPLEEKFSPYLLSLIAEQPGERIEPITLSFCEDQIITPESTQEQLERLRAPAFAMLSEELAPLIVSIRRTSWSTQSLKVEMQLGRVLELAERTDVLGLNSGAEPPPPPP